MAYLAGTSADPNEGRRRAKRALESGAALDRLGRFIEAQGGDPHIPEDTTLLPTADIVHDISAQREGWLAGVDTEAVGHAAAGLGAGRRRKDDPVDPAVGLELRVKISHHVGTGGPLARVFARSTSDAAHAERALRKALRWSEEPQTEPPLVHEVIEPNEDRTEAPTARHHARTRRQTTRARRSGSSSKQPRRYSE